MSGLARLDGQTLVIKYGGAAMDAGPLADSWAADIARLTRVGARVVVVHGGGPALSELLARVGVATQFVEGHRVTDADTASLAEMVLSGHVNKRVVARLRAAGVDAFGLSGGDGGLLSVTRHRPGGRDIGNVGQVERVDTRPLEALFRAGYTPVVSSTAAGPLDGEPYNINADLVAGALAVALSASALVFVSNVPGVLVDGARVPRLDAQAAQALLASGGVAGGMRPKLESALDVIAAGVGAVHLVDGRQLHALSAELSSDEPTGTRLISGEPVGT